MKKLLGIVFLLIVILFYSSCGGVAGNISKYSFAGVPPGILKDAMFRVYDKYPEVIKSDTTKYGNNDGEEFYYLTTDKQEKIVFKCHVIPPVPPYDTTTELSLTAAAVWGQTMKLAPDISFWEKWKFAKQFEEHILPQIKEMVNTQRPIILNEPM